MSFFADLKDDLSQVAADTEAIKETKTPKTKNAKTKEIASPEFSLDEMLQNIDNIPVDDAEINMDRTVDSKFQLDEDNLTMAEEPVVIKKELKNSPSPKEETQKAATEVNTELAPKRTRRTTKKTKTSQQKMDTCANRQAIDETAIITAGMTIKGDVISEGSLNVIGSVKGNIDVWGKLVISGHTSGDIQAGEIYVEGAKISGELVSPGAVKIGPNSVILGHITAKSAVIAGAVKGDIDVQGPVILDTSAIVMGNIKSKSVQINNGAVVEGMCSQCYADIDLTEVFSN